MESPLLIRYSPPTVYDQYPMGTQCKVITTLSPNYDLYQQINHNPENPQWILIESKSFVVSS